VATCVSAIGKLCNRTLRYANRMYVLTFYVFNKRVPLLVKGILMLSKCTVQQLKKI